MSGQREGERQLGPLAAGELADLPLLRDGEVVEPVARVGHVEGVVEVAGRVEHVGDGQVPVQGHVLRDECDPVQCGRGSDGDVSEDGDLAFGRCCQSDGDVEQRCLAGAVRADESDEVAFGDGEGAVPQRPVGAVAAAELGRLEDVHAAPPAISSNWVSAASGSVWSRRS